MTVVIETPVQPDPLDYRMGVTTEASPVRQRLNRGFLNEVLGYPQRYHYMSRDRVFGVTDQVLDYDVTTASLGIQAIHQAFAGHVALGLRPDTLWYFIVHEVAEYVRQHVDESARLFTDTPEAKQKIRVRDDSLRYDVSSDWMRAIRLFHEPLRERLTDRTMELFLPRFSTSTIEDETSLLVALMDVASPYYEYEMMTRCGIPKIRLEGEAADWRRLYISAEKLLKEFPGLTDYRRDLLPVLETIATTASGETPNESFWRSIYKYEDGSGAPRVTGWITAFFAYAQTPDGARLKDEFDWRSQRRSALSNSFPSHLSRVPFVWDYFGEQYDMAFAAGVTGVEFDDDEFLAPRLGFAVLEV